MAAVGAQSGAGLNELIDVRVHKCGDLCHLVLGDDHIARPAAAVAAALAEVSLRCVKFGGGAHENFSVRTEAAVRGYFGRWKGERNEGLQRRRVGTGGVGWLAEQRVT